MTTESGEVIGYDYLVMAPGLQLDFDRVPGLTDTVGRHGVAVTPGATTGTRPVRWSPRGTSCWLNSTTTWSVPEPPVHRQLKPRRNMYLLKRYGLPALYWQGMLKGRA